MIDQALKQRVLDELAWQPGVDEAHIGVTVRGGVVTLTGQVGSYAEKCIAERAAARVIGVRAIAEELEIRYASGTGLDDDIARQALDVISWDIAVPNDRVKIRIENGWVTLSGDVDWRFQKQAAEADICNLFGVMGVSNAIEIRPKTQVSDVEERIKAAFHRSAEFEAENIVVTLDGRTVTLTGQVGSYHARTLAAETAWSAAGVTQVHELLTVDRSANARAPDDWLSARAQTPG
jgi:osmotically-inducible protein OsmY